MLESGTAKAKTNAKEKKALEIVAAMFVSCSGNADALILIDVRLRAVAFKIPSLSAKYSKNARLNALSTFAYA